MFHIFYLLIFIFLSFPAEAKKDLTYCVPVKQFNFNPYSFINNGNHLAYYIFALKSYISTDSIPGILEAYEFSSDGRTFTGRVSKTAVWSDGTIITPYEAALGIAKGITFRTIGGKIKVADTDRINMKDWENRKYKGIKVFGDRLFSLNLESKISNVTGVFREALSSNSRHNRLWPIRLVAGSKNKLKTKFDLITKYPIHSFKNKIPTLEYGEYKIRFINDPSGCSSPNFSLYPEYITTPANYNFIMSSQSSAASFQPNQKLVSRDSADLMARWLREMLSEKGPHWGIEGINRFFIEGEPGYSNLFMGWESKLNFVSI